MTVTVSSGPEHGGFNSPPRDGVWSALTPGWARLLLTQQGRASSSGRRGRGPPQGRAAQLGEVASSGTQLPTDTVCARFRVQPCEGAVVIP